MLLKLVLSAKHSAGKRRAPSPHRRGFASDFFSASQRLCVEKRSHVWLLTSISLLSLAAAPLAAAESVTFLRDVAPILNKTGCTAGPCHGAAKGKNGFKLSLRGYDPQFD